MRFWHRLFREYLAASRLVLQDKNTELLVKELWDAGRLTDPFWEDVVRLLPRTQGVSERAQRLEELLRDYAQSDSKHEGRLLGLAAAAIVESRDLFPNVRVGDRAKEMMNIYRERGALWPMLDRILFLEALGRIDPSTGDPRLNDESNLWVEVIPDLPKSKKRRINQRISEFGSIPTSSFWISWCPVTVQQYRPFVDAADRLYSKWWADTPADQRKTIKEEMPYEWQKQLYHPNWPVTWITRHEAEAWCRWQSEQRTDGKLVRLPKESEWIAIYSLLKAKHGGHLRKSVDLTGNYVNANIGHCTPVGAFPAGDMEGLTDLNGNVFQWGNFRKPRIPNSKSDEEITLHGIAYNMVQHHNSSYAGAFIASSFERAPFVGFRCVLE